MAAWPKTGYSWTSYKILARWRHLLSDGAEGGAAFTLAGFVKNDGNEAKDHYYLAEWRNHAGVDKGLAHINVADQLMRCRPGMLLWVRGQQPG